MSAAWVFIVGFFVASFLKCNYIKKLIFPIGVFVSVLIAYWLWERRNVEHVEWFGIIFLTFGPIIGSYMWNENLYNTLIDEHDKIKLILSSCSFLKIGAFLFGSLLFAIGRLCLKEIYT